MEIVFKSAFKLSQWLSFLKIRSFFVLFGIYLSFVSNNARADGSDLLADPARNLFSTFSGTGINLLILIEICAGIYLFSTSRKMAAFVGIPLILAITAWAKVKFGG